MLARSPGRELEYKSLGFSRMLRCASLGFCGSLGSRVAGSCSGGPGGAGASPAQSRAPGAPRAWPEDPGGSCCGAAAGTLVSPPALDGRSRTQRVTEAGCPQDGPARLGSPDGFGVAAALGSGCREPGLRVKGCPWGTEGRKQMPRLGPSGEPVFKLK